MVLIRAEAWFRMGVPMIALRRQRRTMACAFLARFGLLMYVSLTRHESFVALRSDRQRFSSSGA